MTQAARWISEKSVRVKKLLPVLTLLRDQATQPISK